MTDREPGDQIDPLPDSLEKPRAGPFEHLAPRTEFLSVGPVQLPTRANLLSARRRFIWQYVATLSGLLFVILLGFWIEQGPGESRYGPVRVVDSLSNLSVAAIIAAVASICLGAFAWGFARRMSLGRFASVTAALIAPFWFLFGLGLVVPVALLASCRRRLKTAPIENIPSTESWRSLRQRRPLFVLFLAVTILFAGIAFLEPQGQWVEFDASSGSPTWSPDGRYVMFWSQNGLTQSHADRRGIPSGGGAPFVASLADSSVTRLDDEYNLIAMRWAPTGPAVALYQGVSLSIAEATPGVTPQFRRLPGYRGGVFLSWSPDARLIAFRGIPGAAAQVANADLTYSRTIIGGTVWEPSWSPDSRYIVDQQLTDTISRNPLHNLAIGDVESGETRTIASGPATYPVWSPTRSLISVLRKINDSMSLCAIALDGTPDRCIPIPGTIGGREPPQWSPDGRFIAALVHPEGDHRRTELLVVEYESGSSIVVSGDADYRGFHPFEWSPDSNWLAYNRINQGMSSSYDAPQTEIAVVSKDGSSSRQITRGEHIRIWMSRPVINFRHDDYW